MARDVKEERFDLAVFKKSRVVSFTVIGFFYLFVFL